jgi:uncharacterized surface protein with fasciclin (FAS1) repeats
MLSTRLFCTLCVCALLALAACADQPRPADDAGAPEIDAPAYDNTIMTVSQDAGLTTFMSLAQDAGLAERFERGGMLTVFAPSDEAFAALEAGALEELRQPGNRDALRAVLEYHLISQQHLSADMAGEQSLETVNGESLTITATDFEVTLTDALGNTATVVSADLEADNGVIHVIDAVMLPSTLDELVGDMGHDDDAAPLADDEAV